jgi:hypothetical protein
MWVCHAHMKEALTMLEIPHIRKAPYKIKCSLCDNRASAKVYYTHQTYKATKNQYMNFCKKLG